MAAETALAPSARLASAFQEATSRAPGAHGSYEEGTGHIGLHGQEALGRVSPARLGGSGLPARGIAAPSILLRNR